MLTVVLASLSKFMFAELKFTILCSDITINDGGKSEKSNAHYHSLSLHPMLQIDNF